MENNNKNISAESLASKKFDFDDPIQRGEEQWDSIQKTKLIDSLLRGIPVDPARVIKSEYNENGEITKYKHGGVVIDGKQRLENIIKFLNDEYPLDVKYLLAEENEAAGAFKGSDDKEYKLKDLVYDINYDRELERARLKQEEENEKARINEEKSKAKNKDITIQVKTITPKKVPVKLAGMKFSKLPQSLQDKLKNTQVTICELTEVTPWERVELFKRQNNGKPLTKAQMNNAEYDIETYKMIKDILAVPGQDYIVEKERHKKDGTTFLVKKNKHFKNIWYRQLNHATFTKGDDRQLVVETLMLISNFEDGNTAFTNDKVLKFINVLNNMTSEERTALADRTKAAVESFNEVLDGETHFIKNLKKTSMPMLIAGMDLVITEGKDKKAYIDKVKAFFDEYDTHTDYKESVGAASAHANNVRIRWNTFKSFVE